MPIRSAASLGVVIIVKTVWTMVATGYANATMNSMLVMCDNRPTCQLPEFVEIDHSGRLDISPRTRIVGIVELLRLKMLNLTPIQITSESR
ncbi:MAG: hypothetical protein JRI33_06445 [Deltaproteobacteria bacterium]|nr:hypothetical protein [Deltaproteobacteria bacterium]